MSGNHSTSPLWSCWDSRWAWVARCLSGIGRRGLASRETCSQDWVYKYTAQSSHRHKTCTVTTTVAVHLPCIQILHKHTGLCIGPLWKLASVLAVDCHTSLCFHDPQKNTNTNTHLVTYEASYPSVFEHTLKFANQSAQRTVHDYITHWLTDIQTGWSSNIPLFKQYMNVISNTLQTLSRTVLYWIAMYISSSKNATTQYMKFGIFHGNTLPAFVAHSDDWPIAHVTSDQWVDNLAQGNSDVRLLGGVRLTERRHQTWKIVHNLLPQLHAPSP